MPKRRHASPGRAVVPVPSQKDVADAIVASTLLRLQQVPEQFRPKILERNGSSALTYASVGEILKMGSVGGAENNLVTWAITTDQVDRANDRVDPSGVNIKRFLDNPVILWNHDSYSLPIGTGVGAPRLHVFSDGRRGLLLDILFHEQTRESHDVANLVRGGFLRANSIGFIPLEFGEDEPASMYEDAYPWLDTVRTFKRWELLEDSICTIPMNPGALVQSDGEKSMTIAVERGLIAADSPLLNAISPSVELTTPPTLDSVRSAMAAMVPDAIRSLGSLPTPTAPTPRTMHDCSCAMLMLSDPESGVILEFAATIGDADLAPDGREVEPHITIKYGLKVTNPKVMKALLADVAPFSVTLGEVSVFSANENRPSDVVKIDVVSRDLVDLHDLISDTFECEESDYDAYSPHLTLAYVKSGRGSAYAGPCELTGTTIEFTEVAFSTPDGTTTTIPLGGTQSAVSAALASTTTPNTMTNKDATLQAAAPPDPAAPAPDAPPAAPAPEAPAAFSDMAYVDSVIAGLQQLVADSGAAVAASQTPEVQEAAQSVVDILGPGIEEFVALKEKLTADAAPEPAAPAEAPPADPNAPAALSWRSKAGATISAKNKRHVEAAYEAITELKKAADANTITDDPDSAPKAIQVTVMEGKTFINGKRLDLIIAEASGAMAAYTATKETAQEPTPEPVAVDPIALAQKRFGHLL